VRHLISAERLPFTATYFGSIALTLYFAVGVRMQHTHSHIFVSTGNNSLSPPTPQTPYMQASSSTILQQLNAVSTSLLQCLKRTASSHHHDSIDVLGHMHFYTPLFEQLLTHVVTSTAPKHPPHTHLCDRADCCTHLVPCLVLPYGIYRFALCCKVWWKQVDCLDGTFSPTLSGLPIRAIHLLRGSSSSL